MGLTPLTIDSNGYKVANPRFLTCARANLRHTQKALSRRQKGSFSRAKARLKLAKANERRTNAHTDFHHKLTRQLIDDNQAVVLETLSSKNMLKNRKLAKHIADASWYSFIQKLEYKAKADGKHLVKINQWFASLKTCHACNHKTEALALSVRQRD
ncbi:transposase [Halomonas sp. ISL-60]|uniref:RNA-guided endonuclease InsQ/TnpB family protein n=1 Tax=Halomonas sp. ISL-56 TaxID=2819149 RepID=UPI001BE8A7DC|nr:RNA-guided endonuclease TnpB family protein [Halomonas sp. ISL-56]MBT2774356.1 transposase [Halomonas sp. ISL-60]MBT2799924.1 transposase [Halomonas sp. ISL-56]